MQKQAGKAMLGERISRHTIPQGPSDRDQWRLTDGYEEVIIVTSDSPKRKLEMMIGGAQT